MRGCFRWCRGRRRPAAAIDRLGSPLVLRLYYIYTPFPRNKYDCGQVSIGSGYRDEVYAHNIYIYSVGHRPIPISPGKKITKTNCLLLRCVRRFRFGFFFFSFTVLRGHQSPRMINIYIRGVSFIINVRMDCFFFFLFNRKIKRVGAAPRRCEKNITYLRKSSI